ncbi:MAG: Flp family type IVb pilin [Alphaproteobacteria bacterium]|nr:MAG: Flp family type IVb pilin [Alphaproteobacteria bacterium]
MRKFFKILRKSEKGATAIEYGLIAALIAVAVIGAMTTVGTNLKSTFDTIGTQLNTTATPPAA